MARQTVKKSLPVKLTAAEFEQRAEELAFKSEEYDRVEEKKKSITSDLSDELKGLRSDMRKLADVVEHKREFRVIECEWHEDLAQKRKSLVRNDTGEVIESVALTPEELQGSLGLQ